MTQTQDEQNVSTPVTPSQDNVTSDPEATTNQHTYDETTNNITTETKGIVNDVDSDSSNNWLLHAYEIQWDSLIDNGKEIISETLNTGMEKIQWIWQAGVEWIQNAASQWVESITSTLEQWWDLLREWWQNTIEWIKGIWQDLKDGFWNIISEATSGKGVIESWTAIVQWTVNTATNVVWNAATNVMNTWTSVVNGTIWAVSNVATWAGNVVKDSVNNIAWAVLPGQAAQWVTNFTNTVSQWAQDLWNKAKETLQETGQKAKWFFTGLWDNFKSWFSNDAQKVIDEANAPIETTQQTTSQVQQPTESQPQQPTESQAQQPAEIQAWDTQQPTNPA